MSSITGVNSGSSAWSSMGAISSSRAQMKEKLFSKVDSDSSGGVDAIELQSMLDDIAKEYSGRLKVVKINIDENQKTPMTYGIRGIPTLMVFKGGKVEATQIGGEVSANATADFEFACTSAPSIEDAI